MGSREDILARLRAARTTPLPEAQAAPDAYLPVTPLEDHTAEQLLERFVREASLLSTQVHQPESAAAAVGLITELVGPQARCASWGFEQLPLAGLEAALLAQGTLLAEHNDPTATVGLSSASAGLAATGSLVLASGPGRYRAPSLLPPRHIAVLEKSAILPNLETWVAQQRAQGLEQLRASSNIVIVSGASRTADIAMELILGMHGPGELQIVLV